MSKIEKPSEKDHRQRITEEQLEGARNVIRDWLRHRLDEKGCGALLSRHEILGVITEEYIELIEAVKFKSLTEVKAELRDMAVGCIFGIACIDAKAVDW